jgi:hypothetical protein
MNTQPHPQDTHIPDRIMQMSPQSLRRAVFCLEQEYGDADTAIRLMAARYLSQDEIHGAFEEKVRTQDVVARLIRRVEDIIESLA